MAINGAQLHLVLNHLPIGALAFGIVILGMSLYLRSIEYRRLGLLILIFGALMTIPTYFTGESAEEIVKNYPGPNRYLIHQHEDLAFKSFLIMEILGLVSLYLLFASKFHKKVGNQFLIFIIIIGILNFGLMARVAHLGGLIRHEEIRNGGPF